MMMCSNEAGMLTLDGLLQDPLTRMIMRSDGVSERDFSDLLLRVQDCLADRCAETSSAGHARNRGL